MRTSLRSEAGQIAIVAAMFVAALLTLATTRGPVPIRFDLEGRPTAYGDASFALLMPPVLTLALYVGLRYLPLVDPGRANYASFAGTYGMLRWAILIFLAGVYSIVLLAVRGIAIDVGLVVPLGVGALFVVLGNVMGKLRPNWFIGIRTPWTLSSKRSWTRTHAVGGRVFVMIGVVWILIPLARGVGVPSPLLVPVAVVIAVAGVVYLFVYSYVAWRSDPDRIPPAGTLPAE